jgi:hypothetical protein
MDTKNDNTEFKPVERHVKATLAVLRENEATGWKRVMTVTRWGTGKYKLDIRDWNRDMTRSTKGITFSRAEAIKVRDILMILDMNLIEEYPSESRDNIPVRNTAPQDHTAPAGPADDPFMQAETAAESTETPPAPTEAPRVPAEVQAHISGSGAEAEPLREAV